MVSLKEVTSLITLNLH